MKTPLIILLLVISCFGSAAPVCAQAISPLVRRTVLGPPDSYFAYPHSNGFWRPDTTGWGAATAVIARRTERDVTELALWDPSPETPQLKSLGERRNLRLFYSVAGNGMAVVISGTTQLLSWDLRTNVSKVAFATTEHLSDIADISADGNKAVVTIVGAGNYKAMLIDLVTGAARVLTTPGFMPNHIQFSPFANSWVAYCNEGDALLVRDRLWAWHPDLAPQGIDLFPEQRRLDLAVGHERALFHKPGLLAVAYFGGPGHGLYEIGFDRSYRLVSENDATTPGLNAWHCNISRDGRWAVIDTGPAVPAPGSSSIIAVNYKTGVREILYRVTTNIHPYHPHPHISPDNKWIFFNDSQSGRVQAIEIDQERLEKFLR